jgi:hypothetical protein
MSEVFFIRMGVYATVFLIAVIPGLTVGAVVYAIALLFFPGLIVFGYGLSFFDTITIFVGWNIVTVIVVILFKIFFGRSE